MDDGTFPGYVAGELAKLTGVEAVALGGSRAEGTAGADSDWDFAVYYRGAFEPGELRALGWPGEVSAIGEWGGGVFNGGAWLTIDGRRVDVHYRDLGVVEHELAEARAGRFRWEPLMFHFAGIPSYLVVGELAVNQVLHGSLPRPEFPAALREPAARMWRQRASLTLGYAEKSYAPRRAVSEVAGALVTAAMETAHAVLAERGEWVTNEKRLLLRAGLRGIDVIVEALRPEALGQAVSEARELLDKAH
ncbi:nucleotidyltransferase domain-containing protein [Amycolatopsis acidicola]|uniref:Nucleotidyltransferase domain-containing protein n=1 Tax=Amycolatopsis acidicola TaxID=2596893 RepID=A0A5N0UXB5_9PSEU|nr:nucleotidyltransferase domain-containing protein [Amycolatopsis acidicola]KAA9158078.1 nucleotidyltransferase domain-containing protein [Amycolatopsis acidicola]